MQYSNSSINHFHQVSNSGSSEPLSGHSTHFQVGGDNSKVEGGPVKQLSKAKPYFTFTDIFIFENKVAVKKMPLDVQFAWCPAAVQCLALYDVFFFYIGRINTKTEELYYMIQNKNSDQDKKDNFLSSIQYHVFEKIYTKA
jgi:hypothetical protein